MKFKKLRKRSFILSTLSIAATAGTVATVASCSHSEATNTTTQKNNEKYLKDYGQNLMLNQYYSTIAKSELEKLSIDYNASQKEFFANIARYNELKTPGYWTNQITTLIQNGQLDKVLKEIKVIMPDANDQTIINGFRDGKVADIITVYNRIIDSTNQDEEDKILLYLNSWQMQVSQALVQYSYLEYNQTDQTKKEDDLKKGLSIVSDAWKTFGYKNAKYPILTKWIKENHPYLLWEFNITGKGGEKDPGLVPAAPAADTPADLNALIKDFDTSNKKLYLPIQDPTNQKDTQFSGYLGIQTSSTAIEDKFLHDNNLVWGDTDLTGTTQTITAPKYIATGTSSATPQYGSTGKIQRFEKLAVKSTRVDADASKGIPSYYTYDLESLSDAQRKNLEMMIILEHSVLNDAKKYYNLLGYKLSSDVELIKNILSSVGDVS
ncbi:MAG: hypothetical protein NC236_00885 [Mycoplasma sp.]|nr:hypothetical protein [Mycoplasma sp.]